MYRIAFRTLPLAIVMVCLSNCARVEPVTLKQGKMDGRAWGDPPQPSEENKVLAGDMCYKMARFFNM